MKDGIAAVLVGALFLAGCGGATTEAPSENAAPQPAESSDATAPAANPPTAFLKNVSAEEAAELLKKPGNIVVLDIRTPEEFQEGHIAGATNVNFSDPAFAENLGKLDKSQTYLMHCRSGGRSGRALGVMREMGFQAVYHLKGGTLSWEEAGQPLVK